MTPTPPIDPKKPVLLQRTGTQYQVPHTLKEELGDKLDLKTLIALYEQLQTCVVVGKSSSDETMRLISKALFPDGLATYVQAANDAAYRYDRNLTDDPDKEVRELIAGSEAATTIYRALELQKQDSQPQT